MIRPENGAVEAVRADRQTRRSGGGFRTAKDTPEQAERNWIAADLEAALPALRAQFREELLGEAERVARERHMRERVRARIERNVDRCAWENLFEHVREQEIHEARQDLEAALATLGEQQ